MLQTFVVAAVFGADYKKLLRVLTIQPEKRIVQ